MSPTISTTRRTTKAESAEELIRHAHALLEARGTRRSCTWVNRMVRSYLRGAGQHPFEIALAEELDASTRRPLGYRDPTAEQALRNLERRGGTE